ncbi:relaxase/mobilization nuclease domain-containing protein [Epibacterium ulvae]|uniref:relaxase/mobilization nuclease domain-containing protein n=1 Tax=Epibacterium ulvae TaxID=1156985 RepID=UPI0024929720|nr:relaxase [Epibacterium ulvae]
MILVGNQRGGGQDLANHLMKDENERVTVHEVRGFVASDLHGAFKESYAISRATKCQQHLYSLSLNPPKNEQVTVTEFEHAIACAEDRLGLTGQPRAVVFHEKIGSDGELRRHAHAVWCRIDTDEMKAIHMSHDHHKLNDVSRDLYLKHGWTMPKGLVKSEWKDPSTYSLAEWQQAKRAQRDPRETKMMFQDAWAVSDSRAAFQAALKERGLILARGDRRGYVALDHQGEIYAIAKWTGQKTKDVKARLGDADQLPSVKEAHQQATKIVTDRLDALRLEQERKSEQDRARLAELRQRQGKTQQDERTKMDVLHKLREQRETKERDARVRKGFKGLIDRITGKRRKIEAENQKLALKAKTRDQSEKEHLAAQHAVMRERLETKKQAFQERRRATIDELGRDQSSLQKNADTRHSEQQFKERRSRPSPRPKRGRARDGPSL